MLKYAEKGKTISYIKTINSKKIKMISQTYEVSVVSFFSLERTGIVINKCMSCKGSQLIFFTKNLQSILTRDLIKNVVLSSLQDLYLSENKAQTFINFYSLN